LSGTGTERVFTVADDGKGMTERALRRWDGVGLKLMKYHARLTGAQLDVRSAPDEETTVTCSFNE
jgi:signal transduction histidine kinase